MSRDTLSFISTILGLSALCFFGIAVESGMTDPNAVILTFMTGLVAAAFHDEYKKEGKL